MFSLFATAAGAGATDISSVVVCLYSSEASSVICKNPNHSDSTSISFVLLKLVLISCSYCYTCFIFSTDNAVLFHLSLLQGELIDALPNVTILS